MFSFLFKRVPMGRTVRDSTTQLGFLRNFSSLKSNSSKDSTNQNPFVASYLISSCGFSPAAAISVSKKIDFESSERPDSVLTLFRNHGFTEAHISSLIRKCPLLLLASPTNTLLPKLEFLLSLGISTPDIAKIISQNPKFLFCSLENRIIPAFNFFKSIVGSVENVVIGLKRQSRYINYDIQNVVQNIAILRENGVPEPNLVKVLTYYPRVMTYKNDRFKQRLEELLQMGFHASKYMFIIALHVFISVNKSTWKYKLEAFQRWGFSENEILFAFKRYPWFMSLSEKKIMSHMDFFVNKMGWELADMMTNPQLRGFSLEKRVIPRCSVLRLLQLKGLMERDHSIGSVLIKSDESFMEKFVTKYEEEVPQLLDVYKGKIGLPELGYGSEEVSGLKPLRKY